MKHAFVYREINFTEYKNALRTAPCTPLNLYSLLQAKRQHHLNGLER